MWDHTSRFNVIKKSGKENTLEVIIFFSGEMSVQAFSVPGIIKPAVCETLTLKWYFLNGQERMTIYVS
jgi:hypothetical protein